MADASIVIPAFRNHGLRETLASLEPLAVLGDQVTEARRTPLECVEPSFHLTCQWRKLRALCTRHRRNGELQRRPIARVD